MELLTATGGSVAADAGKSLLAKLKLHIGYLFDYSNNMKSLEDARVDLEANRNDAIRLVNDASTQFRDAGFVVTRWRTEADTLHEKAQSIITEYNRRRMSSSCLNPWSRYSSSKEAWKLTQEIIGKIEKAKDFGTTFERLDIGHAYNLAGVMDFESRLSILKGLLEAIKDQEVRMCSICGMGGVGKTTLAKKLIQRVEPLPNLFDKVVMVTVSANPNFEKIQSEIIQLLGLKMEETVMPARANKLHHWLSSKRTLLILDDVWWMLTPENFEAIGIPLDNKACKIVFTSRNEDECKKMGSKHNFCVGILKEEEAWDMFRKFAGEIAEDLNICGIARNIAAECGGLPIAIATIATTLKDKSEGIWSNSLLQLQNSNLSGISDMEKVYSRIKLSYDLLQDMEAQSCFRLCCLYPEDYNIPIEDLVLYGKSLNLFGGVNTMKEARDRVEWIMDKLKTSFMLLDGDKYECVKMHDIVRDFAVSFSSKADDPYIIECDNIVGRKWPETSKFINCSAISIMSAKMPELPVDLEFPKLELLRLRSYSNLLEAGILGRMKELKVISLKVPSLSQSLTVPKKLRGLFIKETAWLFEEPEEGIEVLIGDDMMNLEYFSVSSGRKTDFPMEIGILCNLRFLRLSRVTIQYIPPGVLSKLVKLEELYLPWGFEEWGCTEWDGSRINASFDEIKSLPLTALEVLVPDGSVLTENMVKNLTRFQIHVGSDFCEDESLVRDFDSKTAIYVREADSTASWISGLVRKSESLSFVHVKDLKNNGFERSKKLRIYEIEEMEYFVDRSDDQQNIPRTSRSFSQLEILQLHWLYNLKEVCHNVSKTEAPLLFRNLIEIYIMGCEKLKSGFPLSVARGLSQLRRIDIMLCDEMEKVCYIDDDNHKEKAIAQFSPSTPETTSNFDINNHKKANLNCPTPNSIIRGLLGRRKHLESVPDQQQQVEENRAKVSDGKQVDVTKSDENRATLFPQLKALCLLGMPKLRVFYDGNDAIELPSLESLSIDGCEKMEIFSYGSCTAPILQQIMTDDKSHQIGEEDINTSLKQIMLNREKPDIGDDMKDQEKGEANNSVVTIPGMNGDARNLGDVKPRITEESNDIWKLTEISEPSQCRSLRLPENMRVNKISRLIYTNSGNAILALASNAIHLLWKWQRSERNSSAKATANVPPQLCILMTNDITDTNLEEAVPCFALSKNDCYVVSASGGKISLFNMVTFKTMTTCMPPPPAATFLAFHPQDNNIIAIGMDDSTIQIYNVRVDEVIKSKLKGHSKRITGLAFSDVLNVLVSSGADAQLCVWNSDGWEKQETRFLQVPPGRTTSGHSDTCVQFHGDRIQFLVVHETQLAIYKARKLECVKQWVTRESSAPISHATFSCDSQLVYASFLDATVCVFSAQNLRLRCRINPSSYLPANVSNSNVHPLVIAAHPQEANQFALGLSDGGVHVFEPLESEGKWGVPPPAENGSASSVPAAPSVGPSGSDQAQR